MTDPIALEVVRLRDVEGKGWQDIASTLGLKNRDAASRAYTAAKERRGQAHPRRSSGGGRRLEDTIEVAPQPFEVEIPAPVEKAKGKWQHAVVIPDPHQPYTDPKWERIVLDVIRDVKPAKVICLGDLLDCYSLSKFDTNPARLEKLQDEIDLGRKFLWRIAEAAPQAERHLLEGNHEDRLRRTVWNMQGAHRELARLREFQRLLRWENLLQLEGVGFSWTDYADQPRTDILPLNAVMHGVRVNKHSAGTARLEHETYHMSGISGHTHRLGMYFKRDIKGSHCWVEAGHGAGDLEYAKKHENHHQGLVVTTYTTDRKPWFGHELVFVEKGYARWGTTEYRA